MLLGLAGDGEKADNTVHLRIASPQSDIRAQARDAFVGAA